MKKILITGAAGYIGSQLAYKLAAQGYFLILVDDLSAGTEENWSVVKKEFPALVKIYTFNILIKSDIDQIFLQNKIDLVIHCAALKNARNSFDMATEYYSGNVGSLLNILNSMKKFGVSKIIFLSSAAVYGNVQSQVNENDCIQPLSPYGDTKRMCEEILSKVSKYECLNATTLRLFNPIGVLPEFEENHFVSSLHDSVLFKFLQCAKNGNHFLVNGVKNLNNSKSPIRDFIYIEDLLNAIQICVEKMILFDAEIPVLNIGTGIGTSIFQLAKKVAKLKETPSNIVELPPVKGDVEISVANINRITEVLEWRPKATLEKAIDSLK